MRVVTLTETVRYRMHVPGWVTDAQALSWAQEIASRGAAEAFEEAQVVETRYALIHEGEEEGA